LKLSLLGTGPVPHCFRTRNFSTPAWMGWIELLFC